MTAAVAAMKKMPQVECPVVNRFTPGLYTREMSLPAGTIAVSLVHKTEHPFVVSKGKLSVWTEGEGVKEISAPFTGITKAGTRRIVYVIEDAIWTTFHATRLKDSEKIGAKITFDPLKKLKGKVWLGLLQQ